MSGNPLTSKAIIPYAQAIFGLASDNVAPTERVSKDLLGTKYLFDQTPELKEYFENPVVSKDAKCKLLEKAFKSELHPVTFKFLMVLVKRDRITLLGPIVSKYSSLLRELALVKTVRVSTAHAITNSQESKLIKKLKYLTNARTIDIVTNVDSTLIGGFVIKTESKVIDFSIKNKIQMLAKHLDTVLEI